MKKSNKRMYVIVRRDLSETYRLVQGSHALAAFALQHPNDFKEWKNHYLIVLSVRNLIELRKYIFKKWYLNHSIFYEPDLENQPTALACYCDGKIFSKLKLA
jgi:hypothetical protein